MDPPPPLTPSLPVGAFFFSGDCYGPGQKNGRGLSIRLITPVMRETAAADGKIGHMALDVTALIVSPLKLSFNRHR